MRPQVQQSLGHPRALVPSRPTSGTFAPINNGELCFFSFFHVCLLSSLYCMHTTTAYCFCKVIGETVYRFSVVVMCVLNSAYRGMLLCVAQRVRACFFVLNPELYWFLLLFPRSESHHLWISCLIIFFTRIFATVHIIHIATLTRHLYLFSSLFLFIF